MSEQENSFEDLAFLIIDRIERNLADLKDQCRGVDEFMLMAHAKVNELIQKQGPGLPHVLIDNQMPQSIGVRAGWNEGQYVIQIYHRGEPDVPVLPVGHQMRVEV